MSVLEEDEKSVLLSFLLQCVQFISAAALEISSRQKSSHEEGPL